MRVFRISFALWYDPHWRANFRKSRGTRRYWIAAPSAQALTGRALALQLGPVTFKLYAQGRSSDNG